MRSISPPFKLLLLSITLGVCVQSAYSQSELPGDLPKMESAQPSATTADDVVQEETKQEAPTPLPTSGVATDKIRKVWIEEIERSTNVEAQFDLFKKIDRYTKYFGNQDFKYWTRIVLAKALTKSTDRSGGTFWAKYAINSLVRVPSDFKGLNESTRQWLTELVQTSVREIAQRQMDSGDTEGAEESIARLQKWQLELLSPSEDHSTDGDWIGVNLIPMSSAEQQARALVDEWFNKPSGDTKTLLQQVESALKPAPSDSFETIRRAPASIPSALEEIEIDQQEEVDALGQALKRLGSVAKKTAGIVYFVTDKQLNILAINGSRKFSTSVPIKAIDLERLVSKYLRKIQSDQDPGSLGSDLYKLLVAPIRERIDAWDVDQIVVSVDDSLSFLPFAALPDLSKDQAGQPTRYMVNSFAFAVFSPTKDLRLLQPRRIKKREMLALGLSEQLPQFPSIRPLPGVKEELEGIFKDGWVSGNFFLNQQFNLDRLKQAGNSPITHIATHFVLKNKFQNSYLILGNGEMLTMNDFIQDSTITFKNTELLNLSACYTGVDVSGRPVKSFGALAHRKGARSVIATLWQLPDKHAPAVARLFYKTGADNDLSVSEILQKTQIEAIKEHLPPSAWASMVLFGAWL